MAGAGYDLRSYLDYARSRGPEHFMVIPEKVPLDYTSTALTLELEKRGRNPILLFENIDGYDIPVVSNLFATREHAAWAVGSDEANLYARLGDAMDNLIPARRVSRGAVQEVIREGDEVDLAQLPIARHFRQDAGAYVTAGMIAARDPDTGVGNLAYARLQFQGPRRMGASIHSRQHLWDYYRRAELAGKDLPVAVVIGAHPALMIAAASKMAIDVDEYDLAGALMGQSLDVCRAHSVDVDVPAHAEIVIEGHLLAQERGPEGPFGEYTGYASSRSSNNVFQVSAITMRPDPIFVDIVPGNSSEHLLLGHISYEAWVHKRLKEALPFFVDFHFPSSGIHFHCYIRIDKTAEGQAQQAAQLLFGLDPYTKLVVVVDKDIDPSNEHEVLWAIATHLQADRRVSILSNTLVNRLDPSSADGLGAKMLLDATRPLKWEAARATLPDSAVELARRLLDGG
ncbi:MAG: UbiD family decarboxylase [Ardenticatenaceae bacterium]|nr:UbiD family decarboxylase [Ardenticatenaceae bacterium]HBY94210.1 UbiD family decarboxylase [Chloroflexota bacterium]